MITVYKAQGDILKCLLFSQPPDHHLKIINKLFKTINGLSKVLISC